MAVSTLKLTVEEKNYWKFCMLNVRVVPDALRKYFDSLIQPSNLATVINQNSTTISYLFSKRVINAVQFGILKRVPGTIWPPTGLPVATSSIATTSADFDVSFLVCLLRNIPLPGINPPGTGWDNLPIPNDLSPGAYLARIKYYRNEIAHSTQNNMNSLDFQDRWKTVSEAITFCNGGHTPNGIKEILQCDLDGSHNVALVASLSIEIEMIKRDFASLEGEKTKMENDLKRIKFQLEIVKSDFNFYKDGNLPKNISDNIYDLINKWRIEDKPFYVTKAGKHVYDRLESENVVMIIGHPGSGKSATARNVALKWMTYGYNVVPVESVEKMLEYRCKGTNQMFVMDDVLGKYSIIRSYVNQWERLDSKLAALFMNSNAKLICTLRKVLATDETIKAMKMILTDKASIIDLDKTDNCLRYQDKMSILKNHLVCTDRQNDISEEECTDCCKGSLAFPLLCHLFTTSDSLFKYKSDFFRNPYNFLNDEITKLYKKNKRVYCSLVICMMFSGKLKEDLFSISDDEDENQEQNERIFRMLFKACGLNRNISKQTLLKSLLSVEGVYIERHSGIISFVHDTFLEAISFHFSMVNVRVFLECCDSAFLMNRVRINSPQVNDDQNIIVLPENYFCYLAIRFIRELKNGHFMDVLCSQPIQEENFVQVMGKLIHHGHLINIKQLMDTKINCLRFWNLTSFHPVLRKENSFEAVSAIMEIFTDKNKLIHWIIATGCHSFFDFFLDGLSQKQHEKFLRSDKSYFALALLSGCEEIIIPMIERGADVNSQESQYALQRLVINGKTTALLECLMHHRIKLNNIDYNEKTPLFYAITTKNSKIQTFLVERDAMQNEMHEAVYNSNIEKTKDILSSYNINLITNYGWCVFHFAAYINSTAMMNIIFETAIKSDQNRHTDRKYNDILLAINKRDIIGWTPLHLASVLSNYEAVNFLMSKGANANLVDLDGKTPLHLSCSERVTCSLLKNKHNAIEPNPKQYTKTSTSNRHHNTDDFTKNITKKHFPAKRMGNIPIEVIHANLYSHEVMDENNIYFKEGKDNIWTPYINGYLVYEGLTIEIPQNMNKWHPPLLSMIYVTCMNILYWSFSIVKFRKDIDIPDKEGNTPLHAAAMIENQGDSIASVKRLLEKGANPLLYNNNGCLPSDVAFYKRTYIVKHFLDIYAMHSENKRIGILVLISIITFVLVLSLCSVAHSICPGYINGFGNDNLNSASICNLQSFSNDTLYCDIDMNLHRKLSVERTEYLPLFSFIHPVCMFGVLYLNLVWALGKKLLWRQKCFPSEGVYFFFVHLTAILKLTCICFSNRKRGITFHYINFDFFEATLVFFIIDIYVSFKQRYHPEWLMFLPFPFRFISYFCVIFFTVILHDPLSKLISKIYLISSMLDSLSSFSMMSLLLSFILTFVAFYIYINVLSCCAYLILLKIWGKFKYFRQISYCLQIGIFEKQIQSHANFFPLIDNPSFKWQIFFQSMHILILLIFETIVFYN